MITSDGEVQKLLKCHKFADKLIAKAVKERDTKGYRENLGYDSENKLNEYMSEVGLDYSYRSDVLSYFTKQCDEI